MNHLHTLFSGMAGTEDIDGIVDWLLARIQPARGRGRLRHRLQNMLAHDRASEALTVLVLGVLDESEGRDFRRALDAPFAPRRAAVAAAQREVFRPHIWILHERNVPSSVAMFALANGVERWQRLRLPADIAGWPLDDQQREVARVVGAHRLENTSSPFLGVITGYRYQPAYDHGFDVREDNGVAWSVDRGQGRQSVAVVRLG